MAFTPEDIKTSTLAGIRKFLLTKTMPALEKDLDDKVLAFCEGVEVKHADIKVCTPKEVELTCWYSCVGGPYLECFERGKTEAEELLRQKFVSSYWQVVTCEFARMSEEERATAEKKRLYPPDREFRNAVLHLHLTAK